MSREANIKEFYTLPKSPKKSDVYRHIRDNENSKTTLSQLRHLSAMEKLTKQFANNFSLPTTKEKKGQKCNALHQKEIF